MSAYVHKVTQTFVSKSNSLEKICSPCHKRKSGEYLRFLKELSIRIMRARIKITISIK